MQTGHLYNHPLLEKAECCWLINSQPLKRRRREFIVSTQFLVQGYLAHKKQRSPRTLQEDFAQRILGIKSRPLERRRGTCTITTTAADHSPRVQRSMKKKKRRLLGRKPLSLNSQPLERRRGTCTTTTSSKRRSTRSLSSAERSTPRHIPSEATTGATQG